MRCGFCNGFSGYGGSRFGTTRFTVLFHKYTRRVICSKTDLHAVFTVSSDFYLYHSKAFRFHPSDFYDGEGGNDCLIGGNWMEG